MKETDLYEPVKTWLESKGYKVYSEVSPRGESARADAVGICDHDSAVVELKLSLSLDLLEQATNWSRRGYANYTYIAVPVNKRDGSYIRNWLVNYICRTFNVGVLFVKQDYMDKTKLVIDEKPFLAAKYQRTNRDYNFIQSIKEFQYEYDKSDLKGGQKGGGYVTPYRVSMDRVKYFLSEARYKKRFGLYWYEDGKMVDLRNRVLDGWVDIKTILDYCETHYASPKQSLAKALINYENDWCECEKIKGKIHFRYKGEQIKDDWD